MSIILDSESAFDRMVVIMMMIQVAGPQWSRRASTAWQLMIISKIDDD